MRAAAQQRDLADFVIKHQELLTVKVENNSGTASINMWGLLGGNANFRRIASIYDQVSIKGIRVCLTPQTTLSLKGGSPVMIYNWDRNGRYTRGLLDPADPKSVYYTPVTPSITEIQAYGSAKTVSLGDLSIPRNYYMAIYPKTITEKMLYLATRDVMAFNKTNLGQLPVTSQWTPTLNLGVATQATYADNSNHTETNYPNFTAAFQMQITYCLRCRGVRFLDSDPSNTDGKVQVVRLLGYDPKGETNNYTAYMWKFMPSSNSATYEITPNTLVYDKDSSTPVAFAAVAREGKESLAKQISQAADNVHISRATFGDIFYSPDEGLASSAYFRTFFMQVRSNIKGETPSSFTSNYKPPEKVTGTQFTPSYNQLGNICGIIPVSEESQSYGM